MKREDLVKSREYVVSGFQLSLLNMIEEYMKKKGLNRNELAAELGVTKGYVSQLLNVSYDHKISKLVDLSLACGKMPLLNYIDMDEFISSDAQDKYYELIPMQRPKLMTFSEHEPYTLKQNIKKADKQIPLVPLSDSKLEAINE